MSKTKYYHIKKIETQKNWLPEAIKMTLPNKYKDISEYLFAVSQN